MRQGRFAWSFLIGGFAVLVFTVVGAGRASAQAYYFDFTSSTGTIDAVIRGLDCTTDCTLSAAGQITGTITVNGVTSAISFNPAQDDGGNILGADDIFSNQTGVDANGLSFDGGGKTWLVEQESSPGSGGVEDGVAVIGTAGGADGFGTLAYGLTTQPAPAPVVGGGAWSWLALSVAGLAARRKNLAVWGRSKMAWNAPLTAKA